MLVKTFCAEVMGLEATTITIEVNMTRGVMFHLSGLADTAVGGLRPMLVMAARIRS